MINLENIQKQMRKGVLEFCILSVIKRQESYPSEIIDVLKEADMVILEGTLYPLLSRLKTAGVLGYRWEESPSGPPRKYFHLTEKGSKVHQQLAEQWEQLSTSVTQLTQNR